MKGLICSIYRSDYDSQLNALHGKQSVTIVDPEVDEIFEATEDHPAVRIVRRTIYGNRYVHAEPMEPGQYTFGGTYIHCSDARINAINKYPIPLHDRKMWEEK